jgi:molybdopterin-containing oxidoreductase family iron-sulfur binding subunit
MHFALDGFDFIHTISRSALAAGPPQQGGSGTGQARPPTLYPVYETDSPSWGMSIDLDLCIGCNACVAACTA